MSVAWMAREAIFDVDDALGVSTAVSEIIVCLPVAAMI